MTELLHSFPFKNKYLTMNNNEAKQYFIKKYVNIKMNISYPFYGTYQRNLRLINSSCG